MVRPCADLSQWPSPARAAALRLMGSFCGAGLWGHAPTTLAGRSPCCSERSACARVGWMRSACIAMAMTMMALPEVKNGHDAARSTSETRASPRSGAREQRRHKRRTDHTFRATVRTHGRERLSISRRRQVLVLVLVLVLILVLVLVLILILILVRWSCPKTTRFVYYSSVLLFLGVFVSLSDQSASWSLFVFCCRLVRVSAEKSSA